MENLGAMAYSRYTGFREITDRDVLELHCTVNNVLVWFKHSLLCNILSSHFEIFYFSKKTGFVMSCKCLHKMSESISGKNKKNIINLPSDEFV